MRRKFSDLGGEPPSGRLRFVVLTATVAAFLLVPVAQAAAFTPGTLTVNLAGTGTGEVNSVGGYSKLSVESPPGYWEGTPPIECSNVASEEKFVCEDELEDPEETEEYGLVILEAIPGPGSEFAGFNVEEGVPFLGCGTNPEATEEFFYCLAGNWEEESATVTATFTAAAPPPIPNLKANIEEGSGTVVSSPAGIECGAECEGAFEEGEKVTLTASPAPGYLFKSWKKCDSGGVNGRQCTITAGASLKEVGVKFVKAWSLDASKAGSGVGKIQTSPGGILCLYNCGSAEAAFKEGSVTVKQAAAKHNHFVQWLGDCTGSEPTCVLSMSEDHSVEAEFAPDTQYTLSLSKEGGGQASVKSKPSGLLCAYTCSSQSASFYSGETIEIEVKLNKGTTKLEWTTGAGTCTGSTEAAVSTCTVPMSSAKELVAVFS